MPGTLALVLALAGPPEPDSARLAARIHAYVEQAAAAGFSGVVLVAREGRPVVEIAVGDADGKGARIEPTTIFDIGSITKQFTAAAILRLEERGRLRTADTLGRFFPAAPKDKRGITVHQLLTHSAGLPANLAGDYEPVDRDEFLRRTFAAALESPPGTRYHYSNVGYSVLTAIIEQLTGGTYEAFLQAQFFRPLGMTRTGYQLRGIPEAAVAVGFRGDRRFGRPTEQRWTGDGPYWGLRGNGGVLSTAGDMLRWDKALRAGRGVSQASQQRAYTRHVEEGPGSGSYYGYGWALFPTPRGTTLVAHNGGNGAFYADFLRYLDEQVTIILLSNRAGPLARGMPRDLARMVFDSAYVPELPRSTPTASAPIAPGDPRDQLVQALMAAFADGRPEALRRLVETRFAPRFANAVPMERHVEVLGRIAADVRARTLTGVSASNDELALKLEGGDGPLTLRVVLEGDEPRIGGLGLDD